MVGGRILCKNDGTEDIEDSENDEKRESYRDKINVRKYYAGAKGIGRFSCDRLGDKLILTTQKQDKPIEQLTINWNEFEKDQKEDFEKIKVPHNTISNYHYYFLIILLMELFWKLKIQKIGIGKKLNS